MPLLSIGSSAEVYVKTGNRKSWDFHFQPAWYLYTSEDHYCTYIYLMKKTKSTRLSDTAVHCTKCHTDPTVTQGDSAVNAVSKLTDTISTFAGNRKNDANMTDLQTLVQTVQSLEEQNKHHVSLPVHTPRLPEVSTVQRRDVRQIQVLRTATKDGRTAVHALNNMMQLHQLRWRCWNAYTA